MKAVVVVVLLLIMSVTFALRGSKIRPKSIACYLSNAKGPRPIHKEFTVEKGTPEKKELLDVKSWPTWSTAGSEKYKVGIRSPMKVYDTNELSYIISGKMNITPIDDNNQPKEPVLVQAGDFVTFPDGFACYWDVIETVKKHWYLY